MPWNQNTKLSILLPVVGALFLTSIAGYFISYLFLQEDDIKGDKSKRKDNPFQKLKTESYKIVKIPQNSVGTVIGRHGIKIKFIEEKTKTKISFLEEDGNEGSSSCIISGRFEKVEEASNLIIQSIEDVPVIQYLELTIPRFAVGKVMGINGITVKYLSRKTGANFIEKNRANSKGSTHQIMIKGTCEQIMEAKDLIYEIIKREEELVNQMNSSVASIAQRTKFKFQKNECKVKVNGVFDRKAEEPFQDDNYFEGIVSAVDSPSHFWFQIKSQCIIKLNKLVEEMTTYYDDESNRELFKSETFNYNDIVAARFPHDQKWYRGTICKHEEGDDPFKYVVYFVDFGDTDEVDLADICELRTDFLQLKFQAVEAYLAAIDPKSATPEAMDLFTKLAYVNLLDSVKVKLIGYRDDDKVGIPYVQLINVNNHQEIDIAEEMVKQGFAKRI